MVGRPSIGYQSRSPATNTFGSSRYCASSPPSIVTIQRNCLVSSAIGFPSLSGYSISWVATGWVSILMATSTSDEQPRYRANKAWQQRRTELIASKQRRYQTSTDSFIDGLL